MHTSPNSRPIWHLNFVQALDCNSRTNVGRQTEKTMEPTLKRQMHKQLSERKYSELFANTVSKQLSKTPSKDPDEQIANTFDLVSKPKRTNKYAPVRDDVHLSLSDCRIPEIIELRMN